MGGLNLRGTVLPHRGKGDDQGERQERGGGEVSHHRVSDAAQGTNEGREAQAGHGQLQERDERRDATDRRWNGIAATLHPRRGID
jgi:hypothetical protein